MTKRRLPLLSASGHGESDELPRPAWQWIGFGAVAIFGVWVPLSALAGALAARLLSRVGDAPALAHTALLVSAGYALELAAGGVVGGYLIGRWGPAGVGALQAALAGATAAALLIAATWVSTGPSLGMVLVALLAPAMATVGGTLGLRRRRAL